jgi:fatty-acyl-CoA synthase
MTASSAGEGGEYLAVPSLPDLLVRACHRHGGRPALSIDGARQTFNELFDRAMLTARSLAALGVGRRSRVGIYMPNCAEFVEVLFGASMLGATVVPINNRFRARELTHVQADAELGVILTRQASADSPDHPGRLLAVMSELAGPRPIVVVLGEPGEQARERGAADGAIGDAEFRSLAGGVAAQAVQENRSRIRLRDVAAILYTSGTTAMPKGCVHTHEALVRNGIVTGRSRFLLADQDRFFDPLPMFHVSFLIPLIACVDAGAEMISMSRFDGEGALEIIEGQRATWVFAAFQAIAGGLLGAPSFGRRSTGSVRMSMCIGNPPDLRRFQAAFPAADLLSTYGSTETGGVITYHEPNATREQRVTTCGTAFRGVELAIKDLESAAHLGADRIGEILVRGYSVLDGYLNDPRATAEAVDAEGWLHTGDLGAIDGCGQLIFHGRVKDMIKVGGENVSPAEIEALLAEHPAVLVVHVVGAPDPRLDEVVAAYIEVVPGASVGEQDLIGFCAEQVAGYKVPRYVRFVDDWPMSATKVRKDELRRRIAAELAAAAVQPT